MENRSNYFIIILSFFHLIGLVIYLQFPEMVSLTALNILLCGLLVFINRKPLWDDTIVLFIICIGGLIIEMVGVHTGYLFGNYAYRSALGTKIFDTPIIIGLNWYVIVASSSSLISKFNCSRILKAIIAGALSTLLDVLIEPVAINFDFWSWTDSHIPIWNYVCWFIFSTTFAYIFLKYQREGNKTASVLYFIWLIFFGVLNFV